MVSGGLEEVSEVRVGRVEVVGGEYREGTRGAGCCDHVIGRSGSVGGKVYTCTCTS